MRFDLRYKLPQIAVCVLCAVIVWKHLSIVAPLEGTEFGGGRLTSALLTGYDVGGVLFMCSIILALFFRRVAAVTTVLASLFCLPLYLYFVAPGLFRFMSTGPLRAIFGVQTSVVRQPNFVWHTWTAIGILALALGASVGVRNFLMRPEPRTTA